MTTPKLDKQTIDMIRPVEEGLVRLHNRLQDVDPEIRLTWGISPSLGIFHVHLYEGGDGGHLRDDDIVMWIYGDEREETSYRHMVDKIKEWKKRYEID